MRLISTLRAGLLAGASGWALANGATLMSKAASLPASVRAMDAPDDGQVMTLQVALRLQNIDQLEEKLKAVSTPGSPDYGKYLDRDEVDSLFSPSNASRTAVTNWLRRAGATAVAPADSGWYVNFAATVATANAMLGARFQNFDVDGQTKLRTLEYSVPDALAPHIELISPTTFFGRTKPSVPVPVSSDQSSARSIINRRQSSDRPPNCKRLIEPACLEEMYNFGGYKENATSGSRVAFGSFLNQSAIQTDLTLYQRAYGLPLNNFSVVLINGGVDHQNPDQDVGEANLDSQFMSAAAKTLPITQFITAGKPPFVPNPNVPDEAHNTNEPYLEYYQFLLNRTNDELPHVISNSYGDDEQTVPKEYAVRVCNLIGMMGLRGITVLESSGDTGVGAPCQSNDGKETPEFTPQFPGTCPYITAVGGTESFDPEVVWSASSGGFSNYFPQAWYQKDAVESYIADHVDPDVKAYYSHYTNFSGRAFPDISAHSLSPPYIFYAGGAVSYTGGTSAAAPVVAGLIGLINDARLRKGAPTVGFVNPWLYSLAAAAEGGNGSSGADDGHKNKRKNSPLVDITAGRALGCTGVNLQTGQPIEGSVIPWASWNATAGWDAGTGLGVPDLMALVDSALSVVQ